MRAKKTTIKKTVRGTLKEMIKSANHLVDAHKEIVYREKNNSIFSEAEIRNFCKTIEGINAAARHCISTENG